jgi:hypothetical protein
VYFFSSLTFRVKILLIVLGGINAAVLSRGIYRESSTGADIVLPASAKVVAASSLVFWVGAILAGRLVAYLP